MNDDVRAATPADLDAVASLEWKVFDSAAWSPQSVEQEFNGLGESRHIAVVADPTRIVGYAILLYIGDVADVLRVAVDPDYRRRGWGAKLLVHLLRFAQSAEIARVMLEVDVNNAAAAQLYQRFGFEEIGRRAGYYGKGTQARVMSLDLAPGSGSSSEPQLGGPEEREGPDG